MVVSKFLGLKTASLPRQLLKISWLTSSECSGTVLYAQCHFKECHFKECYFKECLFKECLFKECRFKECFCKECRFNLYPSDQSAIAG
ncbi:pentapeptide repeat-containing protein [Shewanella sp. 6_MG-2023]|uniref:pentapeptide repeat-containing protein n=1 Tax=Shewanella sp. 6_MG-2023 TaxID=3062660 RepID=UPI0034A25ED6